MPKYDLVLEQPLMNAAGSLGYVPDPHKPVNLSGMGAFVTNPVSQQARTPARGPRLIQFPGGLLMHTGFPNPGLRVVLRRYRKRWAQSKLPVIVNLLAQTDVEVARMVGRLEGVEGVMALEIGLPPDIEPEAALRFTQAARGELPLVVRLPLDRAIELAWVLIDLDAAAFSLGPPRGALPGKQSALVHGRLYGPAVFPQALAAVQGLTRTGIPVIAAGGVISMSDVQTMLDAGAMAVQLDVALWGAGWWRDQRRG